MSEETDSKGKGHCRHCSPKCGGGGLGTDWVTWHMTPDALVRWHPKPGCPMCAEVTNVVAFIGALADNDGDPDRMNVMSDVQSSIATHLARGET